jgi:pentalenolactone D synthase
MRRAGDLRALPGDRAALRPLRPGVFHTTVTSTIWDEAAKVWRLGTDRGDSLTAKFVICANGTLSKPKLSKIAGMETFAGHAFHSSRWDFDYTGEDLSKLSDKTVGIIGTGASAGADHPAAREGGEAALRLPAHTQRHRHPQRPADRSEWARAEARLAAGAARAPPAPAASSRPSSRPRSPSWSREEKIRRQENANIEQMMRIHKRIDETVTDPVTAAALKPWYMVHVQAAVLRHDYLPAFNLRTSTSWTRKGRGSPRSARRARSSRAGPTRSTC